MNYLSGGPNRHLNFAIKVLWKTFLRDGEHAQLASSNIVLQQISQIIFEVHQSQPIIFQSFYCLLS